MNTKLKLFRKQAAYLLRFLLLVLVLSACAGNPGSAPDTTDDMGEMEDMEHVEDAHEHEEAGLNRVPNEGAVIQITAPDNGDTFAASQQVIVEIETENFDLTQEGYHWHVYIDGKSWGMVMGGNKDQSLTGLEPGEHMIGVYMSIPSHEELEEGDSIMINITE